MDSIIVSTSELLKLVQQISNDGLKYVELSILESFMDDGECIPASLQACAFNEPDETICYDEIEQIELP